MSVVVLIRRFVRLDREEEFIASYRAQKPVHDPAFEGETLTRLDESRELPEGFRCFDLNAPNCATYLNIATWKSWEDYSRHFPDALSSDTFYPEIEVRPSERAVLGIVLEHEPA